MGTGVTLTPKPPKSVRTSITPTEANTNKVQIYVEHTPAKRTAFFVKLKPLKDSIASTNINEPKTSAD